ncbi:MAG TPA: hypothetical protein VFT74_16215, partial [Isosphaeraceae bacterium]|nr:hypothetical protein [Isosphaeraceae bacterium]
MLIRRLLAVLVLMLLGCAAYVEGPVASDAVEPARRTPDRESALDQIRADSLRGHVSFLASDLLEGRDSPSKGLDLAAEYIASQFRRAGLEPMGDDGYFQTALWKVTQADRDTFRLRVGVRDRTFEPGLEDVTMNALGPLDVKAKGLYVLGRIDPDAETEFDPQDLKGRAVVLQLPPLSGSIQERSRAGQTWRAVARSLDQAALILLLAPDDPEGSGLLGSL